MALQKITLISTLMLLAISCAFVGAQPSCPGALTSLTPCLSISVRNSSRPSSSCCSELANMLQTAPVCLCNALNGVGAEALGDLVNRSLALALPKACNMQLPPVSECQGLNPQNTGADGAYSDGSQGTLLRISLPLAICFTIVASIFIF